MENNQISVHIYKSLISYFYKGEEGFVRMELLVLNKYELLDMQKLAIIYPSKKTEKFFAISTMKDST